jgi:signal peptidase
MTRVRRGGRILRRIFSGLLGAVLGITALVLLGAFVVSLLGIARFVPVLSNSMAPDMPMGSLAIALPVERPDVSTGDVIIFTAPVGPDRRVIHRVTHVLEGEETQQIVDYTPTKVYLETQGDNNPAADPWILTISDDIVWTQSVVVPSAGWPAIWLGDPKIRFAAFGLAGIAIVAWALVAVWRRPPEQDADPDLDSNLDPEPELRRE